jgi:hypothetical protein
MHDDHQIYYSPSTDTIGWAGDGVVVSVPLSSLRAAYSKIREAIGDDRPYEIGFFGFIKKAMKKVGSVVHALAKNPLVKAVAGVVPYGATALQVIETADSILQKAKGSIAKKPAVHQLIRDAARGVPAAKAAMKKLPPAARRKMIAPAKVQAGAFQLKNDLTNARKALAQAGYTPRLVRALRIQRAPWSR